MFIKNTLNNLYVFQFEQLNKFNSKIQHCFTYKNLDFNKHTLDSTALEKNCTIICNSLQLDNLIMCNQKHTNNILIIRDNKIIKNFESDYYDAIITNTSNLGISVFTADCQPILLYDFNKNIIAAVHSGWRGTLNKIVVDTVNKMISEFDCNPQNILCAIGPAIQKCHFEVDSDVANLFINNFGEILDITEKNNKFYIDTVKLNIDLLINLGLKKENIFNSQICTVCENKTFHSFRKSKEISR